MLRPRIRPFVGTFMAILAVGICTLPWHSYAQEAASVGVGDTSLVLSGKTSPYAYITALNGSAVIGTFSADGSGLFSHSFPAQPPGVMELGVAARDTSNQATDTITLQINLQEHFPTTAAIFLPPTLMLNTGSVYSGQEVTVAGMALPDSAVIVSLDNQTIATAQVDGSGNWKVPIVALALAPGQHRVFATNVDTVGNQSFPTSPRSFTVLPVPSSRVVPAPVPPNKPAVPHITSPRDNTTVTTPDITVTGTATPGDQVEIWLNNKAIGSVLANGAGIWSIPVRLEAGSNSLQARDCQGASCSGFSAAVTVGYVSSPAASPKIKASLEKYLYNTHAGSTVTVTAHAANDIIPDVYTFVWGDGLSTTITSKKEVMSASHTYKQPGDYAGEVKITDATGAVAISYFTAHISAAKTLSWWWLILILIAMLCILVILRRGIRKIFNRTQSS